jgi:hypothetical protein
MSKTVKVLEVQGQMEFDFVANILNDNGIGCYRLGPDAGGMYGGINVLGPIELHIDAENVDKAKLVISDLELDKN